MLRLVAQPLTYDAFSSFGQVLEIEGAYHYPINGGRAERFHDLALVETTGENARPLISIVRGQPYTLPLHLTLVERHPFGSQAFMPLSPRPFLVIVAPDLGDRPGDPLAFLTAPGQGINIGRNVWHGVLTPLDAESDFVVIDRGGEGSNLEEYIYPEPWIVEVAD